MHEAVAAASAAGSGEHDAVAVAAASAAGSDEQEAVAAAYAGSAEVREPILPVHPMRRRLEAAEGNPNVLGIVVVREQGMAEAKRFQIQIVLDVVLPLL